MINLNSSFIFSRYRMRTVFVARVKWFVSLFNKLFAELRFRRTLAFRRSLYEGKLQRWKCRVVCQRFGSFGGNMPADGRGWRGLHIRVPLLGVFKREIVFVNDVDLHAIAYGKGSSESFLVSSRGYLEGVERIKFIKADKTLHTDIRSTAIWVTWALLEGMDLIWSTPLQKH